MTIELTNAQRVHLLKYVNKDLRELEVKERIGTVRLAKLYELQNKLTQE